MDNDIAAEHAADPRFAIGGNLPPSPIEILRAELETETAALRARADELVETANEMKVDDKGGAERATALAKMLRDHATDIDKAREARKRDPLEMCRLIDATFKSIHEPLVGPDPKKPTGLFASLVARIGVFRKAEDDKAAAERQRLEDEARQQRERAAKADADAREAREREQKAKDDAAAAVQRAADLAASANREAALTAAREAADLTAAAAQAGRDATKRETESHLTATAAMTQAETLEARAATTVAAPLDSGYGAKAFGRKVKTVKIKDLTAAIRHCRRIDQAAITAAVQAIYDKQLRAGVTTLPGAEIVEIISTVVR